MATPTQFQIALNCPLNTFSSWEAGNDSKEVDKKPNVLSPMEFDNLNIKNNNVNNEEIDPAELGSLESMNKEELIKLAKSLIRINKDLVEENKGLKKNKEDLEKELQGIVKKRENFGAKRLKMKETEPASSSEEPNDLYTYFPKLEAIVSNLKATITIKVNCWAKGNSEQDGLQKVLNFRVLRHLLGSAFPNTQEEVVLKKGESGAFLEDSILYFFQSCFMANPHLHFADDFQHLIQREASFAKKIFPEVLYLAYFSKADLLSEDCQKYMEREMANPNQIAYFFELFGELGIPRQGFYAIYKKWFGHPDLVFPAIRGLILISDKLISNNLDKGRIFAELKKEFNFIVFACLDKFKIIQLAQAEDRLIENLSQLILDMSPHFILIYLRLPDEMASIYINLFANRDLTNLPCASIILALSYINRNEWTKAAEIVERLILSNHPQKFPRMNKRIQCLVDFNLDDFEGASNVANEILASDAKDELATAILALINFHNEASLSLFRDHKSISFVKEAFVCLQMGRLTSQSDCKEAQEAIECAEQLYKDYRKPYGGNSLWILSMCRKSYRVFIDAAISLLQMKAQIQETKSDYASAVLALCHVIRLCEKMISVDLSYYGSVAEESYKRINSFLALSPNAELSYTEFLMKKIKVLLTDNSSSSPRVNSLYTPDYLEEQLRILDICLEQNSEYLPALKTQMKIIFNLMQKPEKRVGLDEKILSNLTYQIKARRKLGKQVSKQYFSHVRALICCIAPQLVEKFDAIVMQK